MNTKISGKENKKQMMDSKMSAAAKNLVTFISLILFTILHSLFKSIQELYSFFRLVCHLLFHLRPGFWKRPSHGRSSASQKPEPSIKMSGEDLEMVMKNLGFHHEREPFSQDAVEIAHVFDREEPRLDEVREAFEMFDENKDGFVDAEELKKVMSSLGLVGLCEEECERMIMVFDDDGDGRISFGEFVKLIEENVCC